MVFQTYALYPHMSRVRQHRAAAAMRAADRSGSACRCFGRSVAGRAAHAARSIRDDVARSPRSSRSRRCSTASRRSSPAASASASRSAAPWCAIRRVPDGRAAVQSRRQAARPHAHRARRAARPPRRDVRLCHARPGRGDDDVRPRRRDDGRRAPAARHAVRALRRARATCASRSSSAARRST